ncbi:MAG: bifunctional phosphoribosylaminoimidazolecarboxamide formyltransferase/IMP cyclohydrolase [Dehalococcoidia bacterium]|nr:bifunctional phosphoribosylaminoimidazolecarboxamide formyltransferase/IMP cyclohydrolase [Dehalococcoidia bacterium]
MRALLSVYDKAGLEPFARGLTGMGWELVSTGGTHSALSAAGLAVRQVSDLTGSPEMMDGRVKTLHPKVHGGILARRNNPGDLAQMERYGIGGIELVAVNLYPFVQTVSKPNVALEEALENIDIGGPTMIRSAAKNFPDVLVLVDPADYAGVLALIEAGDVPVVERQRLARKAFAHVAAYDTAISTYLLAEGERFPQHLTIALDKRFDLRYGENPHQAAAFYRLSGLSRGRGIAGAEQLHGKELSYNNILDADAAWGAAADFPNSAVAVIKHTNPCGLATHADQAEAYRRALAGDPVSAYGGIVAFNRPLTEAAAVEVAKTFYEIVIAPEYAPQALAILQKKRDLRILRMGAPGPIDALVFRQVAGGMLAQTPDVYDDDAIELRVVTRRAPTEVEVRDLRFAWRAVKHVKSNAIVLAHDGVLLGMGAGQPNRVTSVGLALARAGERARGSVLASDAFFPFPDGVQAAAKGGVRAIIQPGGSIRDEETIRVADEHDVAMVFAGIRHFRH